MRNPKRIPVLFGSLLIALGLVALGLELDNRYYRGVSTPFLGFSLLAFSASSFFFVKKQSAYILLTLASIVLILTSLSLGLWRGPAIAPLVYFYQGGSLDPASGRLKLSRPFGKYPPPSGAYLSCHFEMGSWKSYLDDQPVLCSGFDDRLRLVLSVNDSKTPSGLRREVQWNFFGADRKTLLGEGLDRGALRLSYRISEGRVRRTYQPEEIYQAFEKEILPAQYRVLETFTRDGEGRLKSFTESALPNLASTEAYAVYDAEGRLLEAPEFNGGGFVFPPKIDVSLAKRYRLPESINLK